MRSLAAQIPRRLAQTLRTTASSGRRRAITGVLVLCLLAGASAAYAAFTATTTNSGNAIASTSSFGRCGIDEIKADNPVAYWRMDEASGTAMQSQTGSYGGTYSTAGNLSYGQSGALADPANKAVKSTGNGAVATVNSYPAMGNTFSYTAWFKRGGVGGSHTLISKGGNAFNVRLDNGYIQILREDNGTTVAIASQTIALDDPYWHHVAVTKSGNTSKIYIDGVDRTVNGTANTFADAAGPLYLGRQPQTYNSYFIGSMDEVALYNTALSPARVLAQYRSGRCYRDEPRADAVTAAWRLGEPAGSPVAFDGFGLNDGLFSGSPTSGQPGALTDDSDTAVDFDGVDDSISVPDAASLRLAGDMTVEAWVKPTGTPTDYQRIIGKGGVSNRNYGLWMTPDGKALFQQTDAGATQYASAQSASALATGRWHHVAGVTQGSTVYLYVDGVLAGSGPRGFTAATSSDPLTLGDAGFHSPFKGSIDDAAVYGSALSATRVRDHYISGSSYRDTIVNADPLAYWRLGETGTSAANEEGTGAGSYVGTRAVQTGAVSGDTDNAMTTNGTSSYMSATHSNNFNFGDSMSMEVWVKRARTGANETLISKGANSANIAMGTADEIRFSRANVGLIASSPNSAITDTNWHHVVATKSGATVKLYLDGADVTGTVTNRTLTNTTSPLTVGYESTGAYFSGGLDEAAIYNRPLTAAEVALHYRAGRRTPR